ncbi:MAG: hypothetical protein E7425_12940 [Ruminococcaceae bacterium]|nr:hypothetical protein [Oscillospiraceae bacterium]
MAEKYNKAMNKIELSAEARERILGNIQGMELDAPRRGRVTQFPQWKRWTALAACAAVVLLAAVSLNPRTELDPSGVQGSVQIANGIVEYADAQELSDSLGFAMPELAELPFPVTETAYENYWGNLGQISYVGAAQRITVRMQPGGEDVSGDYNAYAEISTVAVNGRDVTLKGNNGAVSTAIWTSNGYSYAISADTAISAEAMTKLVAQIV